VSLELSPHGLLNPSQGSSVPSTKRDGKNHSETIFVLNGMVYRC